MSYEWASPVSRLRFHRKPLPPRYIGTRDDSRLTIHDCRVNCVETTNHLNPLPSHQNNFDFLRICFVVFVLISHSYALSGTREPEFFWKLNGGQAYLSYIGVRGFFVISGFLIYQSMQRSQSFLHYLQKRILRIFPALLLVLILSAMVIGPLSTGLSTAAYFKNPGWFYYIFDNLQLFYTTRYHCLPVVFDNNPYQCFVNGSLWTISYEFLFYILFGLLFFLKSRPRTQKIFLLFLFALLFMARFTLYKALYQQRAGETNFFYHTLIELALFFTAGMLLSSFKFERYQRMTIIFIISVFLIFLSFLARWFEYSQYILLPVAVISFAFIRQPVLSAIRKAGDPSYGAYLWGFPLQQVIVSLLHPGFVMLAVISIPASLLAGYLSWHFVEKKALKWKMKPA